MAESNTWQQCGNTNKFVRQSGKGFLVCQPCYDKIHPGEAIIMTNIAQEQAPPVESKKPFDYVEWRRKKMAENN